MEARKQPFTVLLVEDEPADAELVKIAFREGRLMVDLHHVFDGVEALEYLRSTQGSANAGPNAPPRPDIILLDLNMPRLNGREFLNTVKADPELAVIPVVVLTTSDVERDVMESYEQGAAGYVVKPVDVEEFIRAIQGVEQYWVTVVRLPPVG